MDKEWSARKVGKVRIRKTEKKRIEVRKGAGKKKGEEDVEEERKNFSERKIEKF